MATVLCFEDLGKLTADAEVRDGYVGTGDVEDYYAFELDTPATLTLAGTDLTGGYVRIQLFEQATTLNLNAPVYQIAPGPQDDTELTVPLPAGKYFVRVIPYDSNNMNDDYKLTVTAPAYDPVETVPDPGADKSKADDLGDVATSSVIRGGYVGALDAEDYYSFTLDQASTLTVDGSDGVGGYVRMQLFADSDTINENAPLYVVTPGPNDTKHLEVSLPAGKYFLRVVPYDTNNNADLYRLTVKATAYSVPEVTPDPGSDKGSANDLGTLTSSAVIRGGYVGVLDAEDYYKLRLSAPATLTMDGTDSLGGYVRIQMFHDEATINENSPDYVLTPGPSDNKHLEVALPAGDYYLRVVPYDANNNADLYSFTVQATEYPAKEVTPDPGSDKGAATNLGTLTTTPISRGGYVGLRDAEDYYRITLASDATLVVDGTDVLGGYVRIQLFADATTINESSPLQQLTPGPSDPKQLATPLPAGVYYLRVVPYDANNNADLYLMTVQVQN